MKRRVLVAVAALAVGLASGCASGVRARQEVAVAAAPAGAAAASEPASAGEAAGGWAEPAPSPRPAELADVRELAPGTTYRIGQAVRSGDLIVALLDGRAAGGRVEARFLIHNAGPEEAIVSPGNFRLLTDRGRPRMRLGEPLVPLPVGRLRPGESLRGTVSWEAPSDGDVRVVFANGAASVEWALAG